MSREKIYWLQLLGFIARMTVLFLVLPLGMLVATRRLELHAGLGALAVMIYFVGMVKWHSRRSWDDQLPRAQLRR